MKVNIHILRIVQQCPDDIESRVVKVNVELDVDNPDVVDLAPQRHSEPDLIVEDLPGVLYVHGLIPTHSHLNNYSLV